MKRVSAIYRNRLVEGFLTVGNTMENRFSVFCKVQKKEMRETIYFD